MATPGEHLREADANLQRATTLQAASDAWEIVLLFYSALHTLQAHLVTKGERFQAEDHGARNRALAQAPELREAPKLYRELKALSEQVRYDAAFAPRIEDFTKARANHAKIASIARPKVDRWIAERMVAPVKT